ncbi:MAG: hypothetical protein HS127_11205 [Planctomycetia bacterium]|nr:hypothetical protein [Planctomycetia bacterium]
MESTMTMSMVLKFFLQRKHLARFVFGLVAELNSEQRGQRKRKIAFGVFMRYGEDISDESIDGDIVS